jgi:hypothetical protein
MKPLWKYAVLGTTGLLLWLGGRAASWPRQGIPQEAIDAEQIMKLWAEMAAPGTRHQRLAQLEGKWKTVSKMWMAGPDAPPIVSTGECQRTMILGGRFLQDRHVGTMLGQPYEGLGITGYDNFKKKYVAVWMDTTGTAIYSMQGNWDPSGTVLSLYGDMDEYFTGEHDKPVKYVTRIVNQDQFVFEVHDLTLGEHSRVAEVTFTRIKDGASEQNAQP